LKNGKIPTTDGRNQEHRAQAIADRTSSQTTENRAPISSHS